MGIVATYLFLIDFTGTWYKKHVGKTDNILFIFSYIAP